MMDLIKQTTGVIMENRYIKEFVSLAETCNFQETAEIMHVSQSALSKHIKKMEEELGVSLFDRSTRTVKLNKYGTEFLKYAKPIAQLCNDYESAIYALRTGSNNKLSVGFQARLGQYGILEMLSDFSQLYSYINLNMDESNRPMELLRAKQCDFIFAAEYEPRDPDIEQLLYRVDHLVAVFPLDHPLAHETFVTLQQLRDENFVMHEDIPGNTSMETRKFRKLCLESGFEPKTVMTVSFTSNIVRLVGKGVGIAVMNRAHAPSDIDSNPAYKKISFVDIHPLIPFKISVLYYKKHKRAKAAQDFIQYVKDHSQDQAVE